LPFSYDQNSGELSFGSLDPHSLNGGRGTIFDYYIKFHINDLREVQFALKEIRYDDFIRVTINGKQIYAGPHGGDRLELAGMFMFGFAKVATDGSGHYHSAEQNTWWGGPYYQDLMNPMQSPGIEPGCLVRPRGVS
jgi:hypothetical protein